MGNLISQRIKVSGSWLRFFPYLVLGGLVFSLNSISSFNYIMKGYLVLLETQIGLVGLYFLLVYLKRKVKSKSLL
jgi:hypothetical protein